MYIIPLATIRRTNRILCSANKILNGDYFITNLCKNNIIWDFLILRTTYNKTYKKKESVVGDPIHEILFKKKDQ